MVRDLIDVVGVAGKGVGKINMSTRERPEEAQECPVVVRRGEWDVLVLADGDFRQPVGVGVYGLSPDIADQCVPLGIAGNTSIIRCAEPETRGRCDPVTPMVSGH